jgi:bis(5'-nucleosidyl)-tetraphosphatase
MSPQRKGPAPDKPLIRSAGLIPVRFDAPEPRFLVLRCFNYWDFPKGELEPGEAPLAAALREAREETGLGDFRLRWGEEFIETERYGRGKIARYYLAEASEGRVHLPVSPELGEPEHHEFRWVEAAEAAQLFNPRLRRVLAWACAMLGH